MATRLGFVGLGVIGSRMAKNLLRSGYEVVVYNRSRHAVVDLLQNGAIEADSPEEMAKRCGVVIRRFPTPVL